MDSGEVDVAEVAEELKVRVRDRRLFLLRPLLLPCVELSSVPPIPPSA